MHERGLAGASSWTLSESDEARGGRAQPLPRGLPWLRPDTVAVLDAFLVLGLLGVYLKLALLAPQWGAVARFLGKAPGQPLGWLDHLGFFADDLVLNLLVVPVVATVLIG